ncbi:MAG: TetR/AcrR family transcriptional regulator [Edaphobacter sp.]
MSNARRTPQQERGERRLAQLLESAASVMAEAGYDAATMTAIAERADASIGALYQYFPNKEAIVRALRQQYVREIQALWLPLTAEASKLSIRQLVDRIIDMFVDYVERRPAYFQVLSAPGDYKRDPVARNRLREHFAALFRERCPEMSREAAFRVANVTVQVLKGMNPLYAEAKGAEKEEIVREFKQVLVSYLGSRLKAD